jgi:transposase
VILLWDRFLAHRAKKVQSYIQGSQGLYSEYLPPYAPELNPVENVWGYMKRNPMANDAPYDLLILTKKSPPSWSFSAEEAESPSFFCETYTSFFTP